MVKHLLMIAAAVASLAGCGSLSGYDGSSQFACAAPKGVACLSMSGVNANMDTGTIGTVQPKDDGNVSHAKADGYYGDSAKVAHVAIKSGMPIRTQPRKMRVWWAPWEDSDGDVNDQSYSYMVIDSGHWVMERVRSSIVQKFMPSSESSTISTLKVGNAAPATLGKRQDASSPAATVNGVVKGAANAASQFPVFGEIMKKVIPNAN